MQYFSAFICISLHFSAFFCISLHFSAFLCIAMHFYAFLCISLHFTAFLHGTMWYNVVINSPKGKKAAGRSPLRRFRASCDCEAGCKRGGMASIKSCHVALVFGTFFCYCLDWYIFEYMKEWICCILILGICWISSALEYQAIQCWQNWTNLPELHYGTSSVVNWKLRYCPT